MSWLRFVGERARRAGAHLRTPRADDAENGRPRNWARGRLRFGSRRLAGPTVFAASCAAPVHGAANAVWCIGKDARFVLVAEESGLSQVLMHLSEAASALRSAGAAGGRAASAGLFATVARRPALQQETLNNIDACTT